MEQKIVGFCLVSIFLASLILNFYFIKKDVGATEKENEGNTGMVSTFESIGIQASLQRYKALQSIMRHHELRDKFN